MIDVDEARGYDFAPLHFDVERGRLRAFARAIGESDPVYSDLDVARGVGHRDLPVPPTFFFSMTLETPDPFGYLADLGVDLRHVLHGEQSFEYIQMAYAGDSLVLQDRISDVTSARGGALEFIVKETDVRDGQSLIATMKCVLVVRNPEVAA